MFYKNLGNAEFMHLHLKTFPLKNKKGFKKCENIRSKFRGCHIEYMRLQFNKTSKSCFRMNLQVLHISQTNKKLRTYCRNILGCGHVGALIILGHIFNQSIPNIVSLYHSCMQAANKI